MKKKKIALLARQLRRKKSCTVQCLAEFIGNVVAATPGVAQAPLHYKGLESVKNDALSWNKGNYNAVITLPDHAKLDLQWWEANILKAKQYIHKPDIDFVLFSDASNDGWGGCTEDKQGTGGDWSAEERLFHINYLELKAVFLTLQCFCTQMHHSHIRLMIDNTTAVACINKFGSTKLT